MENTKPTIHQNYKDFINNWNRLWANTPGYTSQYARRVTTFKKMELIRTEGKINLSGKEKLLLDAGCGNGHSVALVSRLYGLKCYGIDIASKALHQVDGDVKVAVADVREFPFAENTFDYILSFGVIEHFESPEQAVAETYRILRPGGWAFFVQPNKFSSAPISRKLLQIQGKWKFGHQVEFTPGEMKRFLKRTGFSKCVLFTHNVERDVFPFFNKIIKRFFWQWGWYIFCLGRK